MRLRSFRFAPFVLLCSLGAAMVQAQQAPKPEQLIKWRQSAYQVLAWNVGRIKASVEGGSFNQEEVSKAARTIAAVADSGLGSLYAPGTDTGKGWHETRAKPELWQDGSKVGDRAAEFQRAAKALASAADTGDAAAVKEQFGKLTKTCKSCHEDYRVKD